jgi:hypothetical protein
VGVGAHASDDSDASLVYDDGARAPLVAEEEGQGVVGTGGHDCA